MRCDAMQYSMTSEEKNFFDVKILLESLVDNTDTDIIVHNNCITLVIESNTLLFSYYTCQSSWIIRNRDSDIKPPFVDHKDIIESFFNDTIFELYINNLLITTEKILNIIEKSVEGNDSMEVIKDSHEIFKRHPVIMINTDYIIICYKDKTFLFSIMKKKDYIDISIIRIPLIYRKNIKCSYKEFEKKGIISLINSIS